MLTLSGCFGGIGFIRPDSTEDRRSYLNTEDFFIGSDSIERAILGILLFLQMVPSVTIFALTAAAYVNAFDV